MRAHRPLSDAHLAEAVRRGVISTEQMETLLALARSDAAPAGAHLPDLRWTSVVLGLAAAITALVPGLALLSRVPEYPVLTMAAACAAAGFLCVVWGRGARALGLGRATAAILTAGAAPYAGGAGMFLVDDLWRRALGPLAQRRIEDLTDPVGFLQVQSALLFVGTAITTLVAIACWRTWRSATVLSAAGFCLPFAAMTAARVVDPAAPMTPMRLVVIATALASLAVIAARPSWGRRDGVDGASWWELGAFAAAALSATAGFDEGLGGAAAWVPIALAVAALGLARRRWTYQLAGALGVLLFLARGLRHEATPVQAGALVAVAMAAAAATQWQRRRESRLGLAEGARAEMSYWE